MSNTRAVALLSACWNLFFNETVAISTAQHQICLIALPPDFQVGQARPLRQTREEGPIRQKQRYSQLSRKR